MNNEEAMQIAKDAAKAGHEAFVQSLTSHNVAFTVADVTLRCYPRGDAVFTVDASDALDKIVCSNSPGQREGNAPRCWNRHIRVYYRTDRARTGLLSALFYRGDDEGIAYNFTSMESIHGWICGTDCVKVDEYIFMLS
jgi:hypothetical protein